MPLEPSAPATRGRWTRDHLAIALLVVGMVVLYSLTLCPTVYWYDSAEFSAHAVTLGVPHPPGYPLYTMVAHVFTWLPGEPALGVNRMSVVFGVGAAVLLYAIVRQLGGSVRAAIVGAAMLATLRTFWANAVVAEVYTPGLVMTLGALLLLLRAHASGRRRAVVLAGCVGGLGVGMHMSIATFGLGYAWLVWTYGLPERIRPASLVEHVRSRISLAARSALAAAAGLLVFVYIPLRRFENWDAKEWTRFRKNATGGTFRRKFLRDYEFSERFELVSDLVVDNLLGIGVVLAVLGLGMLVARKPKSGIGVVLAGAGNGWWFFNYAVPDLDVFYLPALAIGCVGVGLAVDELTRPLQRVRPWLGHAGWLLLALPLSLVSRNYEQVDLHDATEAAAYGRLACDTVQGPGRVINLSSPDEWRYYSVFIYMQATQERCAEAKVWTKPTAREIDLALLERETIYAFRPVEALQARYRLQPEGPLWRVHAPHRARRSRP